MTEANSVSQLWQTNERSQALCTATDGAGIKSILGGSQTPLRSSFDLMRLLSLF